MAQIVFAFACLCRVSITAKTMRQTNIHDRLEKLQLMATWFDKDPALLTLFRELFEIPSSESAPTVPPPSVEQNPTVVPRRKYARRGGSLIDHTEKSLREYGEPTTAKELAQFMVSSGIKFKAKDPIIAVSKTLRHLKDIGKINSKRGDHSKAPIVYWSLQPTVLRASDEIPVQEKAVTQ